MRLVDVEILGSGPGRLYFGLWRPGTGSNLLVSPLRAQEFAAKRKEMTGQGLELIDLEVLREKEQLFYVTLWGKGPAVNQVVMPLTFAGLVARGKTLVKQGFRLADVEPVLVGRKQPSPDDPPTPPSPGGTVAFPPLPPYIRLTGEHRLIVDFSAGIPDPPRISIPVDYLPLLPTDLDGSIIFPDNFCGLRVVQAASFTFMKDGAPFTEFPFNTVPTDGSLVETFGTVPYLQGIDFTGPIGACASAKEDWRFFFPFTQTDAGGGPPEKQLKLVIEMEGASRIEFLNFLQVKAEFLPAWELFKEETFRKMVEALNLLLLDFKVNSGYCGIDQFVQEMCDEMKEANKGGDCLVPDDFETPC